MKRTLLLIMVALFAVSCAQEPEREEVTSSVSENGCNRPIIEADSGKYHNDNFGSAFKSWLSSNGYSTYNKTFSSTTSPNSNSKSFSGWGGANQDPSSCRVSKTPVIFIHGNGDSAQDWAFDGPMAAVGAPRTSFVNNGYNANELFAISVNNPSALSSTNNYHKSDQLEKIKNFILAVKAYTGSARVDVITHSLGVTMTRRAIDDYNLTSYIEDFVAIAGANAGLSTCGTYPAPMVTTKTCGAYFYWGMPIYVDGLAMNSPHLLRMFGKKLASGKLYTIRGINDEIMATSSASGRLSAADANVWINTTSGHYGLMHSTGSTQVKMVTGAY